jgi:hypothetical protein
MKGRNHVRRSLARRALGAGLALAASVPLVLSAAAPATAAPTDVITIAGSDTTELVVKAMFNCGANGLCASTPGVTNPTYNLFAASNQTTPAVIPADPNCQGGGAATYHFPVGPGEFATPNGSSAGRTALINSVAKTYPDAAHNSTDVGSFGGCIDLARSSSFSSNPKLEYYAFAVDAVGVASPSFNAPASLTIQQVRDIYNCVVNDWSQVGGRSGPIVRQVPVAGSGTGDFFMTNVLGKPNINRDTTNFPNSGASGACAPAIFTEENNGKPLATDATLRGNYQNYIEAYSSGKWVFQANGSSNPTVDLRAGARPIALVNNDVTTGVPGAAPATGVRWLGSSWRLNDATVLPGASYNFRTTAAVTSTGTTTITAPAGTFGPNDVGRTVTNGSSAFIAANSKIVSVSGTGDSADLNNATTAAGSGTVNVFDQNRVAASVTASGQLVTTLTAAAGTFKATDVGMYLQGAYINDGTVVTTVSPAGDSITISTPTKSNTAYAPNTYAANGTQNLTVGWSIISDKNPHVLTSSNVQYPGTRYVYNVLHTDSPNYAEARALVGYDDTGATSLLSSVCDGNQAGTIAAGGFLELPALDRDGAGVGQDLPRTCVFRK